MRKSLQAIGFLSTHLILAALLIWLAYLGVNQIPFGFFGRASVGDALSRIGLLIFVSPLIVILAGYLNWVLLGSLHWIDAMRGFSWRLPLFCFGAVIVVWTINYVAHGAIGRWVDEGFGFMGLVAAPSVICLIAACLAAASSVRTDASPEH